MTLLAAVFPTRLGTAVPAAAVSASDTVTSSDIGDRGAFLQVINGGGGSITVTLVDPGTTRIGNVGTNPGVAVPAGEDRFFLLTQAHVNPATGLATVTYSGTTSVTYKLVKC